VAEATYSSDGGGVRQYDIALELSVVHQQPLKVLITASRRCHMNEFAVSSPKASNRARKTSQAKGAIVSRITPDSDVSEGEAAFQVKWEARSASAEPESDVEFECSAQKWEWARSWAYEARIAR